MTIPQFVYPLSCLWTPGSYPWNSLGLESNPGFPHHRQISWSHAKCIFNFIRYYRTIFQSGQSYNGFTFLLIFAIASFFNFQIFLGIYLIDIFTKNLLVKTNFKNTNKIIYSIHIQNIFVYIQRKCVQQTLRNIILKIYSQLEIELPYDLAVPLLGIHTEETRSEKDTCTPMFIKALFIIARTWKQLRCPSADEWIRKLWYIYTMEYYSAIKKNSFESV